LDASGDQFESCHLSPIRRNSVLEELRDKRLEVIQEVICVRAFWRCGDQSDRQKQTKVEDKIF